MSTTQELLDTAKEEIRKALGQPTKENEKKERRDMSKNILNQSCMFADNVLKRLIALTIMRDVRDVFEDHLDTRGSVLMTIVDQETKKETKYVLELDIVDADYMLDLGELKDNPEVKQRLTFLLNTVKVLYCPLKDYMKKWVNTEQNEPISITTDSLECADIEKEINIDSIASFNYVLQIGLNTTLFIDKDTKKRIGIILKRVDEFPGTSE